MLMFLQRDAISVEKEKISQILNQTSISNSCRCVGGNGWDQGLVHLGTVVPREQEENILTKNFQNMVSAAVVCHKVEKPSGGKKLCRSHVVGDPLEQLGVLCDQPDR